MAGASTTGTRVASALCPERANLEEDGRRVLGALALPEHHLGKTGAQRSMVVDAREAEVGERELRKLAQRSIDAALAGAHVLEQAAESMGVHAVCESSPGSCPDPWWGSCACRAGLHFLDGALVGLDHFESTLPKRMDSPSRGMCRSCSSTRPAMHSYSSPSGSSRRSWRLTSGPACARYPPHALGLLADGRRPDVVLVLDLADNLLEDVLDGGDADGAAVLVDDDGHALARALQLDQQIDGGLGLGHERWARARPARSATTRPALSTSKACTVPNDPVDRSRYTGKRVYCFSSISWRPRARSNVLGQRDHVGERHHDVVDGGLGEVEDARDHLALAFGDLACLAALAGLADVEERARAPRG